ncbi:MAG TPA: preprotein translocase subunit YajC [Blastocatellia bacterium]|nr:preprotein translocase subunit YajC [Blastocatellia bacterium]
MITAPGVFAVLFQQGGAPSGNNGGILELVLPMGVIFGIFYLLIIRPQQKKQRQVQAEHDKMLDALKPGDKVVTSGGIYGTIIAVKEKENTVQLKIAQSVSIEVLRSAINGMQSGDVREIEAVK